MIRRSRSLAFVSPAVLVLLATQLIACSGSGFTTPGDDSGDDVSTGDGSTAPGTDAASDTTVTDTGPTTEPDGSADSNTAEGGSSDSSTAPDATAGDATVSDSSAGDSSATDSSGGTDATASDAVASDSVLADIAPDVPIDAGCRPGPVTAGGIFVDKTRGSDANPGTIGSPVATIAQAITLAKAPSSGVTHIYIAQGTYKEALRIPNLTGGLIVEGGWNVSGTGTSLTWAPVCDQTAATAAVTIEPGDPVAVLFDGVTHASGLTNLTIIAADAPAASSGRAGSSIGVWARAGSIVTLTGVALTSGAGAKGADGSLGPGIILPACNGTTDCSTGANGTNGGDGTVGGSFGAFDATGYTPSNGSNGVVGGNGQNAVQPTATITGCVDCDFTTCTPSTGLTVTNTAKCGCGGAGGASGGAGQGGGGSFGLVVAGSTTHVTIAKSLVTAGNGGNGGSGASGAAGAAPTSGGTPSAGCQVKATSSSPVCIDLGAGCNFSGVKSAKVTGFPTTAGTGGAGGAGGGGGGGPSIAVLLVSGGVASIDTTTTTTVAGTPGSGGAGPGWSHGAGGVLSSTTYSYP